MIESLLRQYGYLFVYVGTLFEPDATLVAATFLAHRGYFQPPFVLLVACLATISMSQFWFWLARKRGQAMLDRMSASNPRLARVRGWVERNGLILVFFSRFLWGLRLAIASANGAIGVSPVRFALVDTAGAILWTAIIGTIGYSIAQALGRFYKNIREHEIIYALLLLLAISLFALWRQQEARQEIGALKHPETLGVDAVSHVADRVRKNPDEL